MDKAYFTEGGISSNPLHLEAGPWNGGEESYLDEGLSVVEQFSHFDSSFSSGISPSPLGNDAFLLPEIMGKEQGLGNQFVGRNDDSVKMNLPPLALPSPSRGSGFVERAPKYSLLGSRSFKGRSVNNVELGQRSLIPMLGSAKLSRVCSTPALGHGGSPPGKHISTQIRRGSGIVSASDGKSGKIPRLISNDVSSVSEQMQSAENGPKVSNEMNSKDRRACKRDEDGTPSFKCQDGGDLKRLKPEETQISPEEEPKRDCSEKQKTAPKPPEPPKDYIHVRARRGQATDSHSLAERVRREKISERMKLLQDLVPGCNKVTGKALMLDEIINYVQSLQRQVEFLSMKLASVNPGLDFNSENRVAKEVIYPSNSPPLHHHHHHHHPQFHQTSPPPLDSFTHPLPPTQVPSFNEDDLQSIVLMGFAQDPALHPPQ